MHGDYGHFDYLMFLILDLLTNILMAILIEYMLNLNILTCILTTIDVVNSSCKIWTKEYGKTIGPQCF